MGFREGFDEGFTYREMHRRRLRDFLMVMTMINPNLYIPYHPFFRWQSEEETEKSESEERDERRSSRRKKTKPST